MKTEGEEDRMAREAAQWVARRAVGLSKEESRHFEAWLAQDARHGQWVERHEKTRSNLAGLADLISVAAEEPDADAFAPLAGRSRLRRWVRPAAVGALAACLALVAFFVMEKWDGSKGSDDLSGHYWLSSREVERHFAPDGSLMELSAGASIEVIYSREVRRARLLKGEAYFSVMTDRDRPFVVEAGEARFRALGTAFNVRLKEEQVELLVTEGVVQVARVEAGREGAGSESEPEAEAALFDGLGVNQRAVIPRAGAAGEPAAVTVSEEELDRALQWRHETLHFEDTPLSEAVKAFNARNRDQILLGDPSLGAEKIDGVFRSDNVHGFVTLLEVSGGIRASRDGKGRVILRSK